MSLLIWWILLSLGIGFIGSNRKIGFWGAFFLSFILSPLIGLIFSLTSKTNEQQKYEERSFEIKKNEFKPTKNVSVADEIEKLQSLRNNNIISEEEFVRIKNKIINSNTDFEEIDNDIIKISESNADVGGSFPRDENQSLNKEKINYLIPTLFVLGVIALFLIFKSFNNSSDKDLNNEAISTVNINENSDEIESIHEYEVVKLKNFTYEDIARFAMATSMQEPVNIVKAEKRENYYYVVYTRKSDSQKFEYKVKFEGNRIIWGGLDGRWQDTEYDEKMTFKEIGNKINILGVGETIEYNKGD